MGGGVHPERERGEFLMADYLTTDTDLTTVADAIRTKGGTSAALEWPSGFAQAIADIPSGSSLTYQKQTDASVRNAMLIIPNIDKLPRAFLADASGGAFPWLQ